MFGSDGGVVAVAFEPPFARRVWHRGGGGRKLHSEQHANFPLQPHWQLDRLCL